MTETPFRPAAATPHWSFLTNHGLVLTFIGRHPDSTGRGIALAVGITERAVRTIVGDLLTAGYVERERLGRRNRYRINPTRAVRHVGERMVTVGELLRLLWGDEDRARQTTAPIEAQPGTGATLQPMPSAGS
jgi:DNA-binding transcriptional ArsR family regulator